MSKAIRRALMIARGHYADGGETDPMLNPDVGLAQQQDDIVTSPMGDVYFGSRSKDYSQQPGYDLITRAQDLAAKYGKKIGEPAKAAAENYIGNVYDQLAQGSHLMGEAGKSLRMEDGRLPINATWQYPLGAMQTLLAPVGAAGESAGQLAANVTGDPTFGEKVGFLSGFVGPGEAKMGAKLAMAGLPSAAERAAQLAREASAVNKAGEVERAVQTARDSLSETKNPLAVTDLTGAFAPEVAPIRGQTRQEMLRMQEAALSPQELDKLSDLKAKNPTFANASEFLMPDELKGIISNPDQIEQMNRLLDVIPNAAHMSSLAKAGAPKQGWYRGSTQALIDTFGTDDAPRFAALLAATSPQNSVEMNLLNSLNIWKNWTAAGRPTDPRSIKAVMGQSVAGTKGEESVLDAWVNNTVRALATENPRTITLSGPKVNSFFRNLADDVYRVTNDAWMSNATNISQDVLRISPTEKQLASGNPGYSPAYLGLNAVQREAGDIAKMLPSEVQETAWSVAMPLMESQSQLNLPAREILQRGLLTPDMIRGTPDYSTLLATEPKYRSILEESGYGPQLAAMKPYEFPRTLPEMTTADQENLMKTAETLENLRDLRNREKRSMVSGFRVNPDTAFAFHTAEAVPGAGTGHLEDIINEPLNARKNFTGRISQAFQDPQGMDIINKSLGLKTIATRPTTGAFQPTPTSPIEINPGFAAGVEVPLVDRRGKQIIDPAVEQALRTAATVRGGMTAQLGSPYNAQILDKEGNNLVIQLAKKINEDKMRDVVNKYGLDRLAVADTGAGANVLNWGDKFSRAEKEDILNTLQGKKLSETREVSNPNMNYVDLSKEWQAGVGSRQVTQRMVSELKKLGSDKIAALDNPQFKNAAGDILEIYEGRQAKGQTVRPDLMNMLRIIRDSGLKGLQKTLKNPDQLLPAITSVGLAPVVYQSIFGEANE